VLLRYQALIEMNIFDDWEAMELYDNDKAELKEVLIFLKECNIVSLQTQKVSL
jgi:hypothetical protein